MWCVWCVWCVHELDEVCCPCYLCDVCVCACVWFVHLVRVHVWMSEMKRVAYGILVPYT